MSQEEKFLLLEKIGISTHREKKNVILFSPPCSGAWYQGREGGCVNSVYY